MGFFKEKNLSARVYYNTIFFGYLFILEHCSPFRICCIKSQNIEPMVLQRFMGVSWQHLIPLCMMFTCIPLIPSPTPTPHSDPPGLPLHLCVLPRGGCGLTHTCGFSEGCAYGVVQV